VNRSSAVKSRRPVHGRKIVITTGRLSRHDAGSRPSTLPPRGTKATGRSGGRSRRGCSRQPPVSVPAPNADLEYGDEWEVDDAENIPRESATERYERLTSTVPQRMAEQDVTQEQVNSGILKHFCVSY